MEKKEKIPATFKLNKETIARLAEIKMASLREGTRISYGQIIDDAIASYNKAEKR